MEPPRMSPLTPTTRNTSWPATQVPTRRTSEGHCERPCSTIEARQGMKTTLHEPWRALPPRGFPAHSLGVVIPATRGIRRWVSWLRDLRDGSRSWPRGEGVRTQWVAGARWRDGASLLLYRWTLRATRHSTSPQAPGDPRSEQNAHCYSASPKSHGSGRNRPARPSGFPRPGGWVRCRRSSSVRPRRVPLSVGGQPPARSRRGSHTHCLAP